MTYEERKEQLRVYLGKTVDIKTDRPVGYVYEKEGCSLTHPINYGYIPGVIGGSEKLEVYLLGVPEPVKEYIARIIGIVYREHDDEVILVAAPDGVSFSKEDILKAVAFQEQYCDTHIETCDIGFCECTAQHCKFTGLLDEVLNTCKDKLSVYLGGHRFKLFSYEAYNKLSENFRGMENQNSYLRVICDTPEMVTDERSLFLALFHACKRDNPNLSSDVIFHLRVTVCLDFVEIEVLDIT